MCALQACSVCECDEAEVPVAWIQDEHNATQPGGTTPRVDDDCTSSSALPPRLLFVSCFAAQCGSMSLSAAVFSRSVDS